MTCQQESAQNHEHDGYQRGGSEGTDEPGVLIHNGGSFGDGSRDVGGARRGDEALGVQPQLVIVGGAHRVGVPSPGGRFRRRGDPIVGGRRRDRSRRGIEEVKIAVRNAQLFDGVGRATGRPFGLEVMGRANHRRRRGKEGRVEAPRDLNANRDKNAGAQQQQDHRECPRVPEGQAYPQPAERHAELPSR